MRKFIIITLLLVTGLVYKAVPSAKNIEGKIMTIMDNNCGLPVPVGTKVSIIVDNNGTTEKADDRVIEWEILD